MANFSNLLRADAIISHLSGDSRQQILLELSKTLAVQTGLETSDIIAAVMERERLGSTGVGEGVAIPHARMPGLERAVGAFARLGTPVDFEALDERDCDLVFMLLAPDTAGADHLRALAHVAREFRHGYLRDGLRRAADDASIAALLLTEEAGAAA